MKIMKMKGISLRYKLLAALTIIPMVGLSLFLLLAINIFENDKIAYIFDSSLSESKSRATRVSSEVSSIISLAQAVVLSYQSDTKTLAESGRYYFEREAKLEGFQLYVLNPLTGRYERVVDLSKSSSQALMAQQNERFAEFAIQSSKSGLMIDRPEGSQDKLLLGARFGEVTDPRHVIALTLFEASEVALMFNERGDYRSFLISSSGSPIFASSAKSAGRRDANWSPSEIWSTLASRNMPEGTAEVISPSQQQYLAAFSKVGVADLVVVSMVGREAALRAIDLLLKKSLLFFIAVLSMTAIIAVLASRGLTSALQGLSFATHKVAEGDFGVRVDEKSGGEIGLLATSFNRMAEEVSRLMKETAEKARMESELATAKTVQETLFPESHARIGSIEISGHYTPASECGGDWWYYCENGDKVYIWIGDATGHGAPAALLTSAARAVASVINFGPPRPVSESLGILNQAICDTSKGKMMMTFFLACIDKSTGVMSYANASHEPPLLLHAMTEKPSRDDFVPLNAVNNPRLGEQPGCQFKETSVQLKQGDRIVFYTDGVVDVKNPEQKNYGERRFLKALSTELTESPFTNEALDAVIANLNDFRSETPLDDDVTLILCKYDEAA